MPPPLSERSFDELSEAVLITDETDNIRWANSIAAKITGLATSKLQGMPLAALLSMEELKASTDRGRRNTGPRRARRYRCLLRTESGERREVSVSVGRSPEAAWPVAVYVLRDLRRRREQERGLAAYGHEASLVAHDLRKLMHILAITIRNLRRQLDDPTVRERALRALETVTGQTTHVIGKLAEVSTDFVLERQTTLGEVIRRVLELLTSGGWQEHVAATDIELTDPLPCPVNVADMVQVVFNVLVNAYEAVKDDGRVSLRAHVDLTRARLQIVVEDTGPGFPRLYLERFRFRPFRSTKPGGAGLGLYQANRVIQAHGGTIDVANRAGSGGARVTITLPASEDDAVRPPPKGNRDASA